MKSTILCAVTFLAVACLVSGQSDERETKFKERKARCICPSIYAPVCGRSRSGKLVTYSNSCRASCSQATLLPKSSCTTEVTKSEVQTLDKRIPPPCFCSRIWNPVCSNGRTYDNPLCARCYGVADYKHGQC